MAQAQLLPIALNVRDVVYTPEWVVADMVQFFRPSGRVLDPCQGAGAFLKYLPGADWCEIEKGRDFYAWHTPVDWCFGNPPYGQFAEWMYHSMKIARDVCYLIPLNKPFISEKMMLALRDWGLPIHMRFYGSGAQMNFPTGFAVGAVHFQRGYRGGMTFSFAPMNGVSAQKNV